MNWYNINFFPFDGKFPTFNAWFKNKFWRFQDWVTANFLQINSLWFFCETFCLKNIYFRSANAVSRGLQLALNVRIKLHHELIVLRITFHYKLHFRPLFPLKRNFSFFKLSLVLLAHMSLTFCILVEKL